MKGRAMADKIGRFNNDEARAAHDRAYDELEALWPLPAERYDIPTRFGSTHVRRSGSGTGAPIVLLHPFPGNGLYWHRFIEAFARDRTVYALDTIGAAGRTIQTAPVGERNFAVWFDEVMAGLGVERAHVVGYSQGSWTGSIIALHGSRRLASLSLIEPGVFTKMKLRVLFKVIRLSARPTDANLRKLSEWLTPGSRIDDKTMACLKTAIGYRSTVGWPRVFDDAELRSISTPTLAIFGSESLGCDPRRSAERIAEHLPHGESEIYPGMGHAVLDQIPERVIPRILSFIAQHDHLPAGRA
ncbi:alpha/beta fold hydrolase [Nocardia sp. NPDC055321]